MITLKTFYATAHGVPENECHHMKGTAKTKKGDWGGSQGPEGLGHAPRMPWV